MEPNLPKKGIFGPKQDKWTSSNSDKQQVSSLIDNFDFLGHNCQKGGRKNLVHRKKTRIPKFFTYREIHLLKTKSKSLVDDRLT